MRLTGTFLDEISHDIPHQNWGPEELAARYGKRAAFKGWYLTQEVGRRTKGIIDLYAAMSAHCKAVSGGLPVLILPWIDGPKAVSSYDVVIEKGAGISLADHEAEWGEAED